MHKACLHHGEGTLYAWVIQYITEDKSLANRDFDANELHALFRQLINGCGIYGHQIGLRISNFIEYATQMEDPLILESKDLPFVLHTQ